MGAAAFQKINDVMGHIMQSRGARVIKEGTCESCGQQVKHTEIKNAISGELEVLPMGCICHQLNFERSVNKKVFDDRKQRQIKKLFY